MSFVLCEICLTPADPCRLKPRDLSSFYALNPEGFENLQDRHAWLCSYCWTRVRQCVHFVDTAKTSRIFLTAISFQPNMLAGLKPTDLHLYTVVKLPDLYIEKTTQEAGVSRTLEDDKVATHSASLLTHDSPLEFTHVKLECENDWRRDNMEDELGCRTEDKIEVSLQPKQESPEPQIIFASNPVSPARGTSSDASSADESEAVSASAPSANTADPTRFDKIDISEEDVWKNREEAKALRHFATKQYKCDTCIVGFDAEDNYRLHLGNFHAQEHPFECAICRRRYPIEALLHTHQMEHYVMYACRECNFEHSSRITMNRHYEIHHHLDVFPCRRCDQNFMTLRDRKVHTVKAHYKEQQKCQQCDKTFSSKYSFRAHVIKIHTEDASIRECQVCNKKIRGDMKQHLASHNTVPDPNAYCAECDKQFKHEYSYRSHIKRSRKHAIEEGPVQLECTECGKKFTSKSSYKYHLYKVHLKEKFNCGRCDKNFATGYALRHHVRKVHENIPDVKNKVCDVCDKAFAVKAHLRAHMRTHTGERPFECHACGDKFSYKASLYTHNKLVHLKLKRGNKKNIAHHE